MSWDVCRICLAGNVKMFSIANTQLQDTYEKITSNQWNRDRRPDAICYVCHSQLRSSYKLRVMSKQSEEIFTQLFAEGFEFTEKTIPIVHERRLRKLLVTPVEGFTVGNISQTWNSVQDNTLQEEVSVKIEEISGDHLEGISSVEQNGDINDTTKDSHEDVITNAPRLNDEITEIVVCRNPNKGSVKGSIKDSPHKKDVNQIPSLHKYMIKKDTIKDDSEDEVSIIPGLHIENIKQETVEHIPLKKDVVSNAPSKVVDNKTHEEVGNIPSSNAKVVRNTIEEIMKKKTLDYTSELLIMRPSVLKKDIDREFGNETNKDSKTNDIKHEPCNTLSSDNRRSVCFKLRFNVTNPHGCSKTVESHKKKRVYPFVYENQSNEELDETIYTCKYCDKSFDAKHSLEKHMIITHEEKPYICDICERAFTLESFLKLHQKTHIKPYTCQECPKTFQRSRHLNEHLRIHNKINPYVCKVCEKSFIQQSNLQQHMRTHTGEKPYACDKCDKKFKQKSNLLQHERVHTKEKPYSCDICYKKFGQLSNLQQHRRIHNGEKPFKCNFCLKAFHQKSNLLHHIGRLHA